MAKTGTLEELFLKCKINWQDLEPDDIVDISHLNIEIKSYDITLEQIVWKKVLDLRRQHNAPGYKLFQSGHEILQCNAYHRVLVHNGDADVWQTAEDIYLRCLSTEYVLAVTGPGEKELIELRCEKMDQEIPVLDIQVEDTACYFTNGILSHNTAGGNALKFYASQRVDIRRIGGVKDAKSDDDTQFVGNRTRVKVVKNKLSPPFKQVEFTITYGIGIDKEQDVVDSAVTQGVIKKSGAWFSYQDSNFAQGAANAAKFLRENPDMYKEVMEKLT